ncbi:MAG: CCA tRNA nucleotidyltransferase, partial [Candidatus Woesearchaeota archaeon]
MLKRPRAILGGSMAKGTWLRGIYDVDIFVQFPYATESEKLSDLLEKDIKKLKPARLHGSRDYFQVQRGKIAYEIIPILKITKASQAKNITDISPLHAKWVGKNIKDTDQVRLLKQFAKAQKVYGAESYINGFSGYVLEILIAHYKTFNRLMHSAAKWKPKTIIDIMHYHKNVMLEVNKSKLASPLILIDPVQKGRNTAASLSNEKYEKFVAAAGEFTKNKSKEHFIIRAASEEQLRKNGYKVLFATSKKDKEDITGCKLLKAYEFLKEKLKEHEFTILESGWEFDKSTKAIMWYKLKEKKLPAKRKWGGPPLKAKQHVEAFKRKHKQTYTENKRIYAIIQRQYATPEELLAAESKNPYLKDKVKSITLK